MKFGTLGLINPDGTGLSHCEKGKGDPSEVTPLFAGLGRVTVSRSFGRTMTNIYRLGSSMGAVLAQWKIEEIIPNGDMSGDGRIDISPDGKTPAF